MCVCGRVCVGACGYVDCWSVSRLCWCVYVCGCVSSVTSVDPLHGGQSLFKNCWFLA